MLLSYSQTILQLIPVNSPSCNMFNTIMCAICTARPPYSWYLSTVHTAICAILLCCFLYRQTTLQLIPPNSPYCILCKSIMLLSVQPDNFAADTSQQSILQYVQYIILVSVDPDNFAADTCEQSILQYVQYYYVAVCKARPLYSWYLSTVHPALWAIILCCTLYSQTTRSLLTFISERFTCWQCEVAIIV
jgi:ABC-type enterochelin transport system permease subunit